jgi:hypothetical protein
MAVYRAPAGEWEVRDVTGYKKVWGTSSSRRRTVGQAFQEVKRHRRHRAKEATEQRVNVIGLQAVPPYSVEVTEADTFVLTPGAVEFITRIESSAVAGGPERYHVENADSGETRTVSADGPCQVYDVACGIVHRRCPCVPTGAAAWFETAGDATEYAREALNVFVTCPNSTEADEDQAPKPAPLTEEAQARADQVTDAFEFAYQEAQAARESMHKAGIGMIAHTIRQALPDATRMSVRADDLALVLVESVEAPLWTESGTRKLPAEVGRDEDVLTDLGWEESGINPGVFSVDLPA